MKHQKISAALLLTIISFVVLSAYRFYSDFKYEKAVKQVFAQSDTIRIQKLQDHDTFISEKLKGITKVYKAYDKQNNLLGTALITKETGYGGFITVVVGIGLDNKISAVKIIEHTETPHYGGYITQQWFTDRFFGKTISSFLSLSALEAANDTEIVQVTGATISSGAVIEAVNTAISAYNYVELNNEMEKPASDLKQIRSNEENSFSIRYGDNKSIQITMKILKSFPNEKVDCILQKTTGTKTQMTAEGPNLRTVLEKYNINLDDYKGIGITGRDGYYAMVSKDIIDKDKIILGHIFNGKPIPDEEKPIRVVIPEQFGVYWVKMVSDIDLYDDIAEKNIKSVKMFYELTKDIKPYMYEYYGKKDEAFEIGQILSKFKNVNPKGFFTMASSDGLTKNETIAMVKSRYYIKTTGENAPMNVMPNFKLGSNVKYIAYFSTTEDAVIFPEEMVKLTDTISIAGKTGMPLQEALSRAGMKNINQKSYNFVSSSEETIQINGSQLHKCILEFKDKEVILLYDSPNGTVELKNLLEINQIE